MTIGFVLYGVPYPGKTGGHFVTWSLIHSLLKHGHEIRLCMMLRERDKAENEDFNIGNEEEVKIIDLAKMIWDLCEV